MKNTYCEQGHVVLGNTCGQCARRNTLAAVGNRARPVAVSNSPNGVLVELRTLKSMLKEAAITEEEYDERRNAILASF